MRTAKKNTSEGPSLKEINEKVEQTRLAYVEARETLDRKEKAVVGRFYECLKLDHGFVDVSGTSGVRKDDVQVSLMPEGDGVRLDVSLPKVNVALRPAELQRFCLRGQGSNLHVSSNHIRLDETDLPTAVGIIAKLAEAAQKIANRAARQGRAPKKADVVVDG